MKLAALPILMVATLTAHIANPGLAGTPFSSTVVALEGQVPTAPSMAGTARIPATTNAIFTSRGAHVEPGEEARIYKANVFGSDDRLLLLDLMRKKESTEEERALLAAALQTGDMGCGDRITNGVLISLPDGRDAVIISAHPFINLGTGEVRCDLTGAGYMPNVVLNDHDTPGKYSEISLTGLVETDGSMPMNWETAIGWAKRLGRIRPEDDFLIFPLSRKISDDILPNGSRRGSMKLAASIGRGDIPTYLIGRSYGFYLYTHTHYQLCPGTTRTTAIYHECDTQNTSSSSTLMQYVRGEMVFVGLHNGHPDGASPDRQSMPDQIHRRNFGTPVRAIREYLENHAPKLFPDRPPQKPSR